MPPNLSGNLLKIPSQNGSPVNEYRIHSGQIEFRSLDNRGQPFPYSAGIWRVLNANDLELHFVLNTVVAQWLTGRLGLREGTAGTNSRTSPLDPT